MQMMDGRGTMNASLTFVAFFHSHDTVPYKGTDLRDAKEKGRKDHCTVVCFDTAGFLVLILASSTTMGVHCSVGLRINQTSKRG
jgi:hypothetical protein